MYFTLPPSLFQEFSGIITISTLPLGIDLQFPLALRCTNKMQAELLRVVDGSTT
jgi:hypothetical protein